MKEIELATVGDLTNVVRLRKLASNSLGFIPHTRLRVELRLGNIWVARADSETVGYILLSRDHKRVLQLMVAKRWRRKGIATALLQAARQSQSWTTRVTLRCREDLHAANQFWLSLGFTESGRVQGGRARAREIICYESRPLRRSKLTHQAPVSPIGAETEEFPRVAQGTRRAVRRHPAGEGDKER